MSYKSILVHIDDSKRNAARLDFAIDMAIAHKAHLTGVYVLRPPTAVLYAEGGMPVEFYEKEAAATQDLADKAKAAFEKRLGKESLSFEWRQGQGDHAEVITTNARYADITIMGQTDLEDTSSSTPPDLAELIALSSGRPILTVPFAGTFKFGQPHIMVAWNGSREATRAVHDTLPLLQSAKKVTVLVVSQKKEAEGHGEQPGADIALYLARHGVKAEAHFVVAPHDSSAGHRFSLPKIDVGGEVLSRAADFGADMIVMGAYGHSRLRELVLGGVTHHVFRHMTVPVVVSH